MWAEKLTNADRQRWWLRLCKWPPYRYGFIFANPTGATRRGTKPHVSLTCQEYLIVPRRARIHFNKPRKQLMLFIWRLVLVKSLEQSSVTAQTGDTDSWGDKPLANKINRDTGRGARSGSLLGRLLYDHSDKWKKVPKRGFLNPRDGEREPSVWEAVLRLQRKVYIHGNDRAAHTNQVSLLWLETYQLRLEILAASFLHPLIHSLNKHFPNSCSGAWGYIR